MREKITTLHLYIGQRFFSIGLPGIMKKICISEICTSEFVYFMREKIVYINVNILKVGFTSRHDFGFYFHNFCVMFDVEEWANLGVLITLFYHFCDIYHTS